MSYDNQTDVPTIRIRTIGDARVTQFNIRAGATLKVNGVEVI